MGQPEVLYPAKTHSEHVKEVCGVMWGRIDKKELPRSVHQQPKPRAKRNFVNHQARYRRLRREALAA